MKNHFKRLGGNNVNTKVDRRSFVSDLVSDTATMIDSTEVAAKE